MTDARETAKSVGSSDRRPRAVLIAGPTASGKSAFALELAKARKGVIINADSMQVYAEMRVLTARPTAAEEESVPHRLYGHMSVAEPYSVARWLEEAAAEIAAAEMAGKLPIVVGGTGLYFKALLEGLSPIPAVANDIRERWRAAGETLTAAELHKELQRRDPLTASKLRPTDRQRLVRALEVIEATGRPLSEWQAIKGKPVIDAGRVAKLVITHDREELYERSNQRFGQMMAEGALAEAERVMHLQLDARLPAMQVLGLKSLMALVRGEIDREAAIAAASQETRNYIKRQMTWLRRHMIAWYWLRAQEMKIECDKDFPIVDFMS